MIGMNNYVVTTKFQDNLGKIAKKKKKKKKKKILESKLRRRHGKQV